MAKFTLVQDSSQISTYLECPQKWLNYYVKRLEPQAFYDDDEAMNSGTYGHKLLETYYRMRCKGATINEAVAAFNAYNPDTDTCECGCSKDYHCPIPALNIVTCQKCKKCPEFRPHPFHLDTFTRNRVKKRIAEYTAKYANNDIMPISEQHVEIGFSESIHEDHENLFVLEGRIDVIGKWQGLDCVMDHKLQQKTHWLYMKSIQLKNYALITKSPMAVINYVRLANKVDENTLARDIVTFTRVELAAWQKRLVHIFMRMKKTLQSGQPERNWNACSSSRLTYDKSRPQYCWFTDLCETVDPQVAEAKEKTLFKIKENVWRPW